ncbi:MAG: aspartyl/asparaginyl beta-hydroxylase domain-containing protein [Tatlockia sp.]|nr:aspartyl/asparaginyl beta-hydroxylase domain-containing protein [Tatlockia sp.]
MKGSISHNSATLRKLINWMFIKSCGGNNRPPILATKDIFQEGLEFEERFDQIRIEIDRLLAKRTLTSYKEIDPLRAAEVSENWKLYYILMLGKANKQAEIDCPTILNIAKRLPNVRNATIALLEPGVELAAHSGPYAGILRYHLGILIPKINPPSIRVHDQWHTWKEGESIVIDDFFEHEVVNKSESNRVILMIDFLRPMNPVYHLINRFSLWLKSRWSSHLINKANDQISNGHKDIEY